MIKIKTAKVKDKEQILKLVEKNKRLLGWKEKSWIATTIGLHRGFLIAWDDGQRRVAGFGNYGIFRGKSYIDNIAVDSRYQSQGIAKKLLRAMIGKIKANKEMPRTITAKTSPTNKAIHKVNESLGMKPGSKTSGDLIWTLKI